MKKAAKRTDKALARELKRLAQMPEDQIDLSDIPERTDFSGAIVGKFYRPVKKQVTLRIDADVLAWFKRQSGATGGRGYQTAINAALRAHVSGRDGQRAARRRG